MQTAVFSTKSYDRQFLEAVNEDFGHDLHFFEPRLTPETAPLADGFKAVCVFVNDQLDAEVLEQLSNRGVQLIALRSAGFNNVDLKAAERLEMTVVRVPAYSPHAVAEFTVGLILSMNRNIHRAYARVREGNFALHGLLGSDLHGKTAGIIGTGRIGTLVAKILHGFGCRIVAHDQKQNPDCQRLGVKYVPLKQLYGEADLISLHCPLVPETHHMIDDEAIEAMKQGVMLVNTSRGAVIDTSAVIGGLKSGKVGALAIDVYEEEGDLFFEDLSNRVIQDDVFARLLTFPNVLATGHQAFFTEEALGAIAHTTLSNIADFESGRKCPNCVGPEMLVGKETKQDTTSPSS